MPAMSVAALGRSDSPMFSKTRTECLMRLKRALGEYVIEGVETTIPLFQTLVVQPEVVDGHYDIQWLEQFLARSG